MRLLNLRINFYLLRTFCPHLGSFCVVSSFTTFRPNFTSGLLQVILPRPRIGMLSLVIAPLAATYCTAETRESLDLLLAENGVGRIKWFCCLSHHVFDQVNLWPAWVGFETAIFWQCSPGTVETQRLYPLRYGPQLVSHSLCVIFSGFSLSNFCYIPLLFGNPNVYY